MTPFFLLTMPRSGGTALSRMLDATPGIRCAGESHDLLPRLRSLEDFPASTHPGAGWGRQSGKPESWSLPLEQMLIRWCQPPEEATAYGLRSTFLGNESWEDACDGWSWLLERWNRARLVFVIRDEDDDYQISLGMTWPLWIPAYGTCDGNVLNRTRTQRQAMLDFHEMNPSRTVVLRMPEIFDHEALSAKLAPADLKVCPRAWARIAMERPGDRRLIAAEINAMAETRTAVEEAPDFSGDEPPFTAEEIAEALADIEKAEARQGWRLITKEARYRLPVPDPVAAGAVEIHTLRYGAAPWLAKCAATLEAWANRHGMPVTVWDGQEAGLPHPKFCNVAMLKAFLSGPNDRMIYVDADIFVHPAAPTFQDAEGLAIMADLPFQGKPHDEWGTWCRKHFPELQTAGWTYRNAGVWSIDRKAAAELLEVAREPYIEGVMEQHQWNVWLLEAARAGMTITDLDPAWNCFASEERAAWFHHLAGRGDKMKKLRRLRDSRFLPEEPERFREIASSGPRAISYLWTAEKARWQELQYSLRAALANLPSDVPIHIFADERPDFLMEHPRITVHEAKEYPTALASAVQIADEVMLMNDDIYPLQPVEWEDFATALTRGGNLLKSLQQDLTCTRKWRRSVGRAVLSLHHHGLDRIDDFSTHTPYLFEREKSLETLRRHGCWWKIPFETLYHNDHGTPRRKCGREKVTSLPASHDARFLNHGGGVPDSATRADLQRRFPDPAPWEVSS